MNNKSKHKDFCENYDGTLRELASDIGAMTHAARAEFFAQMANYVDVQLHQDLARGRIKYARKLKEIAILLKQIKKIEDEAWNICKSKTEIISR